LDFGDDAGIDGIAAGTSRGEDGGVSDFGCLGDHGWGGEGLGLQGMVHELGGIVAGKVETRFGVGFGAQGDPLLCFGIGDGFEIVRAGPELDSIFNLLFIAFYSVSS